VADNIIMTAAPKMQTKRDDWLGVFATSEKLG
jgi:hypothetical protein